MRWYKNFVRDKYHRAEIIPAWKGYVYTNFCEDKIIVAPLGFNLVFGFLHVLYLWTRTAFYRPIDRLNKQLKLRKDELI